MLNILIATKPDDVDSSYVKCALETMGHQVTCWYPSDMPAMQTHTFRLANHDMKWSAKGVDLNIEESNAFDVVWMRRPMPPQLNDLVHPDDLSNAKNENMVLYRAFWETIAPNAFWVNPYRAYQRVSCKLTQLRIAKRLGFTVPETIVSNDPDSIINFIKMHPANEVIYKPLYPVMWLGEKELRLTYTKSITLSDLPKPEVLKLTPGIYQKKIEKSYELRVTCMGHTAFATKLYSQEHVKGMEDWRSVPGHELKMEPYALPDDIANKCFALMLKFGIVFGCFDFIVTPEGEYVFLEVNEQGQFLWQEEFNPKINLLQPFTEFLSSRNQNFVWKNTKISVTIPQFRESVKKIQDDAVTRHVNPGLCH